MPKRTLIIGGLLAVVVLIYVFDGNKKGSGEGTQPAANTNQCRVTVTADVLNVRASPDGKAKVVGKYQHGAQTNADKQVTNGYRKLGEDRWAASQYLQVVPGRDC